MNTFQRVANKSVASILRGVWNAELHGTDNIPSGMGAIIAPIHTDLRDGYLLMAYAPRPLMVVKRTDRQNSLHMHTLEQLRMAAARAVGSIIVDRTDTNQPIHWFDAFSQEVPSLRAEIMTAGRYLRSGGLLCMFPQGERRPREAIGELAQGVARIALMHDVPVIPTDILYEANGPVTAHITFGEPLQAPLKSDAPLFMQVAELTKTTKRRLSAFTHMTS